MGNMASGRQLSNSYNLIQAGTPYKIHYSVRAQNPHSSSRWVRCRTYFHCPPFAPYCVTLSFRTPHCLFLVALVLPASFCSIHSSGQHNMVTLIVSAGAELVGLPSFSPPLDQKVSRTLAETVNFVACSVPSIQTKTPDPLRSSIQSRSFFGGAVAGSPESRYQSGYIACVY